MDRDSPMLWLVTESSESVTLFVVAVILGRQRIAGLRWTSHNRICCWCTKRDSAEPTLNTFNYQSKNGYEVSIRIINNHCLVLIHRYRNEVYSDIISSIDFMIHKYDIKILFSRNGYYDSWIIITNDINKPHKCQCNQVLGVEGANINLRKWPNRYCHILYIVQSAEQYRIQLIIWSVKVKYLEKPIFTSVTAVYKLTNTTLQQKNKRTRTNGK